ncbi:Exopolyphosphatase [Ciborinia camelliae]|nr:Exopolyphosphatase [Ciborinia camelliae]
MPLPRVSLSSFLSSAKNALNGAIKNGEKVTFVVGNESADLDSICSAVLLAYLRTYSPRNRTKALYIPLSNLPRADLGLRPELTPVLEKARLRVGDLLSLDDLRLQQGAKLKAEDTKWILVDHNALQGELGKIYGGRVRGVIDHHEEENKVPKKEVSGSCASLVIGWGRNDWEEMRAKGQGDGEVDVSSSKWDGELAYLALGPILIDTNNLQSKEKTRESDIAAVQFLEDIIEKQTNTNETAPWNRDDYFSSITAAKEDIGGMSLRDILRKDYKEWNEGGMNLGISSVVQDLDFLISKAGSKEKFLEVLGEWGKERRLEICAVMTTSHKGGVFRRELLLWGLGEKGVESLRKFKGEGEGKLGLKVWGEGMLDMHVEGEREIRNCWWQERIENSRKQVAPLLRQSML